VLYSVLKTLNAEVHPLLRFGLFEADLHNCELRKQGLKISLQEQPFRVLAVLLEKPGKVITREELRERLWGTDTFVDFDQGLNKAINRVRDALGDSADNPRFIETVPKRGYRFIAPVDRTDAVAVVPDPATTAAPIEAYRHPRRATVREKIAWSLTLLFLSASILLLIVRSSSKPEPGPMLRTSLFPPPNTSFLPYSFAISPDGTRLASVAIDQDGKAALWMRSLSAPSAQRISGSEEATLPFWSSDNQHVGFFAQRKLKALDVATGSIRVLADAPSGHGGTWNREGVVVYSPSVAGPLYRVSSVGGAPAPITSVPNGSGQSHCLPSFLPDGRHFLFYVFRSSGIDSLSNGVYIGELASADVHLLSSEIAGTVAYSSGYLLYVRDRSLVAQPFDPKSVRPTNSYFSIADQELDPNRTFSVSGFTVSSNGVIVYQSTLDSAARLVWFDQSGKELGRLSDAPYRDPSFSPDGQYLAVSSDDARNGKYAIRVHDVARSVSMRLTEPGDLSRPVWAPDGREITYAATAGKVSYLYRVPADGSSAPQVLLKGGAMLPNSWSPAGYLAFMTTRGFPFLSIYSAVDGSVKPFEPGGEAQFSPDGKWIAYIGQGGVAGGGGIVVQEFPGPGRHIQISGPGGAQPRWTRDGRRLFYMMPDRKLMSVSFDPRTGSAGPSSVVFQTRIIAPNLASFQYDVARDGRLLINSFPSSDLAPLTVITGWQRSK
jgi:DNA-binding winged helix-turn-helix (wHTH) protein/Tol biopolymer transport system component